MTVNDNENIFITIDAKIIANIQYANINTLGRAQESIARARQIPMHSRHQQGLRMERRSLEKKTMCMHAKFWDISGTSPQNKKIILFFFKCENAIEWVI